MAETGKLLLRIVTPRRHVLEEEVDEVILPGHVGALGILPEHTPLLVRLGVGECEFRRGRERQFLAIASGFAEVGPHHVTVLADTAERPEEIEEAEARREIEEAEAAMKTAALDEVDLARLRVERAATRLKVAHRRGGSSRLPGE